MKEHRWPQLKKKKKYRSLSPLPPKKQSWEVIGQENPANSHQYIPILSKAD